ncbi:MAG TPA: FTR1 family protein [Tepidisphaeraceae bacterium]|jgi:high-affinity iron transporter
MELPVAVSPSAVARPIDKAQVQWIKHLAVVVGIVLVCGAFFWQGWKEHGNPDPTTKGISPEAAILDTGILVFREGLEAILVLAALTASLVRTEEDHWKPVAWGASASFLATIATWFIVVKLITSIETPARALAIQAGTGLLAVVVLLVVMNWFFHKIYWTGWITMHNRRKRALVDDPDRNRRLVFQGLALIGFTSIYREGFEVVLFLQTYRLQVGSHIVYLGTLIGLALTAIVAFLTFIAHYKLPYKRMLVLTGIMLGAVLVVMVGEEIQEMQQAGWLAATPLGHIEMPDWLNLWFAIFPTWQSIAAQVLSVLFVVGSYYLARRVCVSQGTQKTQAACIVPDCQQCELASPHTASDGSSR